MSVRATGRGLRAAMGAAALLALAGCSMGSLMGGGGDERYADVSASAEEIAQAAPGTPALATDCPPIRVRNGAGSTSLQAGARAVIERATRDCVASSGLITVEMGVEGRVLTGPASGGGSVNVPLRFAVERDGVGVFSQLYSVPVAVETAGANPFSHTVENVQIPYTGGETIVIWVGFEG